MCSIDISVIIPTYNRQTTLLRSIDSVRFQSGSIKEIIIVDDGSTDDTESLIRSIDDARIIYHKQANTGANQARNVGIELASSYWVAFQDSDDVWESNKIEIMTDKIRELAGRGTVDMASIALFHSFFRVDVTPGRSTLVPAALAKKYSQGFDATREKVDQLSILLGNFVSSQTLVMPRQTLLEMGGFETSLARYTDWELAIRIADTMKLVFINQPLAIQYIQNNSISRSIRQGHVARKMIFEKHRRLYLKKPWCFFRQWLRIHYRAALNR